MSKHLNILSGFDVGKKNTQLKTQSSQRSTKIELICIITVLLLIVPISTFLSASAHTIDSLLTSYYESMSAKRYHEAEETAKQIIELSKTKADCDYREGLLLLSTVYCQTGRYDDAKDLYILALDSARINQVSNMEIAHTLARLANVYDKMHQFAKAASTYSESEKLYPVPDFFYADLLYREAKAYLEAQDYQSAEAVYIRMKQMPFWPIPNSNLDLAECYRRAGKFNDAERELETALAHSEISPIARAYLMMTLVRLYKTERRPVLAKTAEEKLLSFLSQPFQVWEHDLDSPWVAELVKFLLDSGHVDQSDTVSTKLLVACNTASKPPYSFSDPSLYRTRMEQLADAFKLRAVVLRAKGERANANVMEAEARGIGSGSDIDLTPFFRSLTEIVIDSTNPTFAISTGDGSTGRCIIAPYSCDILHRIATTWHPREQNDKYKDMIVQVQIAKDGKVLSVDVIHSSADKAVDEEFQRTLKAMVFPQLPDWFKGKQLTFSISPAKLKQNPLPVYCDTVPSGHRRLTKNSCPKCLRAIELYNAGEGRPASESTP
jgi:tetratricopeptide (TPR) repeat protein